MREEQRYDNNTLVMTVEVKDPDRLPKDLGFNLDSDLSITPSLPSPGETVTVSANVRNLGIVGVGWAWVSFSLSCESGTVQTISEEAFGVQYNSTIVLSTTLWLCIIVGCSLFIIILNSAELISRFFRKDIIALLLPVLSVKFIIDSFGIVHETLLRKGLSFKKIAIVEISETLIYGLTSITFAECAT